MDALRLNRPLWLESADVGYPRLEGVVDVDDAVIGAGITGITAAHVLKAEGQTVALVESSAVGTAQPATRPRSSPSDITSSTAT